MESQGTQSTSEDKVICDRFLILIPVQLSIQLFSRSPLCDHSALWLQQSRQLPALEVIPPVGWAHRNTGNITPGAKEWNDTKGPSKKEGTKSDWDLLVMKCHEIHLTGKHTWVGCQPCTNGRFMTLCFHTTGITCYFSLLTCKLKRSCRDSKEMVDHISLPAYFIALGVLVHVLYVL